MDDQHEPFGPEAIKGFEKQFEVIADNFKKLKGMTLMIDLKSAKLIPFPKDAPNWICDKTPSWAADTFDRMTAEGFKLNLITGKYEKTPPKAE